MQAKPTFSTHAIFQAVSAEGDRLMQITREIDELERTFTLYPSTTKGLNREIYLARLVQLKAERESIISRFEVVNGKKNRIKLVKAQ